MSTAWRVAIVLLSLGFLVEAVLIVALLRQTGEVLLSIGPRPDALPQGGPKPGAVVGIPDLAVANVPKLLVFSAGMCSACRELTPRLRWLNSVYGPNAAHGHQVDVVAIVTDASTEIGGRYQAELDGLARTDLGFLVKQWEVPATPFVVALDRDHRVQAAEIVRSADDLETLATVNLGISPVTNGSAEGEAEQRLGIIQPIGDRQP